MTNIELEGALLLRVERAHAQKNYLSAIIAIARLVESELCAESRARMWRLEGFARDAAALIDLDLEHVPVSTPAPATITVEDLVHGARDLLRERAMAAAITIVPTCASAQVGGDIARLREALSNLLANACEASRPGQAVYVDTTVRAGGGHVMTINDRGAGMPPDLVARLGTPVRSTRVGGSGVGVAIAMAIIRQHGGSVHFDSRVGHGTTVTVTLP